MILFLPPPWEKFWPTAFALHHSHHLRPARDKGSQFRVSEAFDPIAWINGVMHVLFIMVYQAGNESRSPLTFILSWLSLDILIVRVLLY